MIQRGTPASPDAGVPLFGLVADVPGADDVDAFALGPLGEVLEVQVLAGGLGVVGVDVEVGG